MNDASTESVKERWRREERDGGKKRKTRRGERREGDDGTIQGGCGERQGSKGMYCFCNTVNYTTYGTFYTGNSTVSTFPKHPAKCGLPWIISIAPDHLIIILMLP